MIFFLLADMPDQGLNVQRLQTFLQDDSADPDDPRPNMADVQVHEPTWCRAPEVMSQASVSRAHTVSFQILDPADTGSPSPSVMDADQGTNAIPRPVL